jgi:8-oxo-dGTP pyrophosphatase MutT (NUDIX family)
MAKSRRTSKVLSQDETGKHIPPLEISTGKVFDLTNHLTFKEAVQAFENLRKPTNRYVVVFAHAHLYKDAPRHVLVVRKRIGSLHAGLFNLPGGRIEAKEQPEAAALRELYEETGLESSCPQLVGAILPSGSDQLGDDFLVYIYRCIINPGSQLAFPAEQPASWELIESCRNGKWVPSLCAILPLLAANIIGFVCQDTWWEATNPKLPDGYVATGCQSLITFLRHSVSDAAATSKQRFST